MTHPPLFTPIPDTDAYEIQPAGVMLILADTVYGEGRHDTPPSGQATAKAMLNDLLSAARAGGYKQADILHTLLAKGEVSHRVKDMARAACAAAGNDRIGAIFAAMRNKE
jgi:hypothetical protein